MASLDRPAAPLNLQDLEHLTGLSNAFLSQLETGRSQPGFAAAVAIADVLGMRVEVFVLRLQ